ncbi:MAG TPA: hypothetical protein VD971_09910 [Phycisphaerales bacterium]|nr:hypothetical protein [Phycisphaerales bacterium]
MTRAAAMIGVVLAASAAVAAPTTWSINTPWDFHTSSVPAQGNLVGTITFDRSVSDFYPAAWSFTLEHTDPVFTAFYPLTISGTYPDCSSSGPLGWILFQSGSPSLNTYLQLGFGTNPASRDILLDGTAGTVNFSAYEWVYRNFNASNRLIYNGSAALVPSPAAALLPVAGLFAFSRRRR